MEHNSALALPGHPNRVHAKGMADRDEFLAWVRTALYEAELALHNGDAASVGRSGRATSP